MFFVLPCTGKVIDELAAYQGRYLKIYNNKLSQYDMLKIQNLRQEGEQVIIKIFNPDDGYSSEQTFNGLKHFKNFINKYQC